LIEWVAYNPCTMSTLLAIRRQFSGAFRPSPWIYWSDLLASAGVGWAAFAAGGQAPLASFTYLAATVVATVALLRAALFIHELAHLKRGTLPGLESVWNFLVGLPLMLPSLMYVESHGDHHRQSLFGTSADPEYASIERWSRLRIVGFIAIVLAVPPLLALRWGVLGPLSYLIPWLRRLVVQRASTLVINLGYRRPAPQGQNAVRWLLQEAAAAVVFWIIVAGGIAGWIPARWLLQWYLVGAGILLVNQVRTLAAHRYNNDGKQLDSLGQLLASINLRGWPLLTVLAAPLGLRYHALHHFLPAVPYHSLGALHRQLLAELPWDSPYRRTERGGILSTVQDLLQRASPNSGSAPLSEDCAAREV
jgi:fatty acid desaturase